MYMRCDPSLGARRGRGRLLIETPDARGVRCQERVRLRDRQRGRSGAPMYDSVVASCRSSVVAACWGGWQTELLACTIE
jgi:hypothetical protein